LRRIWLQDAVDEMFQTHLGLRLYLALVYTSAQEKREKKNRKHIKSKRTSKIANQRKKSSACPFPHP